MPGGEIQAIEEKKETEKKTPRTGKGKNSRIDRTKDSGKRALKQG